jgi:hypothetical protein
MSTLSSAARRGVCRNMFSLVLLVAATIFASAGAANAQTFTVLHTFTDSPDGANPYGGLVADRHGNFYGTTAGGGTLANGTVFKMSPPAVGGGDWTETAIWNFAGGVEGGSPDFLLAMDSKGRLYGEASSGGDATCKCGVVFVLVPPATSGASWTEHVLWTPTTSGSFYGGLILDSSGALYGIMQTGGTFNAGIAFKLTPTAGGFTETTLYNFGATRGDSKEPFGPLTIDPSGNLYGVSYGGGGGAGTVYELKPPVTGTGPWSNTVLKSFNNQNGDGMYPEGNMIFDKTGRLYGQYTIGPGGFFRLTPPRGSGPWAYSILYSDIVNDFTVIPSLTFDSNADLFYGTSFYGGFNGLVFQLTPPAGGTGSWTETTVYGFSGGSDGFGPIGPLALDGHGVLYGTTFLGGSAGGSDGDGVVFSIAP